MPTARAIDGAPPARATRREPLKPARIESMVSAVVFAAIVLALLIGWLSRNSDLLNPEHGAGYALGIIGGSMMLLLLGYPLRKRINPRSKTMGSVGFWFRFHMLLGLLGPTAVLFHSRFTFGSFNSAVALSAMIIVASSGLIGRFLYSRVHRGYSGRKLELRSLKQDMDALLAELDHTSDLRSSAIDALESFEERAVNAGSAFWSSARAVIGLGFRSRLAQRELTGLLRTADMDSAQVKGKLGDFFEAARRAAEFAFYERLLRLWHVLHLPLFVLLVAAVALHIVAVHMY